MQMQISPQEKRMSSSQFSELLGYSKIQVNKKIREMFAQEIDDKKILSSLDLRGYVNEYYLPEIEANMLVAKWDINHLRTISSYFIQKPMTQMEMIASMSNGMVTIERQQLEQANLLSETTLRIDNELAELKEDIKSKIKVHDVRPQSTVTITGIKKGFDKVKPQGFSLEYVSNLVQDAIRSGSINVVSWVNLHPKAEGRTVEGAYLKEANRIIKNAWDIIEGEK